MISPYIRNLRKHIGHELLFVPSVAVLVWDEQGRLLLVHDIDTKRWQTVGGAIEPGETPQQAARREALEEAGIEVKLTRLRTVISGPEFRITYPNGDKVAYASIVFDAKVSGGDIRPDNEETSAVRWWPVSDLASTKIDDFNRALLKEVLK
jgi:8-oxo-dGTP pyrophosphatase MutT (NUDIX family)